MFTKIYRFLIMQRRLTVLFAAVLLLMGVLTRLVPPLIPQAGNVFDEAYFLPQSESYAVNRYYFDPHPPLGKMLLYLGLIIVNPDAADKLDPDLLANKVDNYKTPLNMEGVRLAPRVIGSVVPMLVFLVTLEILLWQRRKKLTDSDYIIATIAAFTIGLFAVFENILIVESRYALLTQVMLAFMLMALFFAFRYHRSTRFAWAETYFALASISLGLAVSIKWLALSIVPIIVLLFIHKEWRLIKRGGKAVFASVLVQRVLFLGLAALAVYLSAFSWHFGQITTYSPAAYEVSEDYQQELKTGEKKVGFVGKLLEWHELARNYAKGVPKLDYSKDDEIGSMWITWPIMARPISYYWETPGNNTYSFVYLIGNPAVWALSLGGVLVLSALAIARLFGHPGFQFKHLLVLLLYFGNWLPFALIERVMYLYHYVPALVMGLMVCGVVLHDFVLPRLKELRQRDGKLWKMLTHPELLMGGWVVLIVAVVIVFIIYAPLTYAQPLSKEQFQQRILLREWNMKWPGT